MSRLSMLFFAITLVLVGTGLIPPVPALAQPLGQEASDLPPLVPYSWEEDFESGSDPFISWSTNGSYTILEKGVTAEYAHSGGRSFKLDVRFDEGSYFYWALPVAPVPAEGRLVLSGWVRLGEETTGEAELGVRLIYPPTTRSGVRRFAPEESVVRGEWQRVTADIIASTESVDKGLSRSIPGLTRKDIGIFVDRIGLLLFGRPGQRVVVYVDDLKLEGAVPDVGQYSELVDVRYNRFLERVGNSVGGWEGELAEVRQMLSAAVPNGVRTPVGAFLLDALNRALSRADELVAVQQAQGLELDAQNELRRLVDNIRQGIENVKTLDGATVGDVVHYVVNPLSSKLILPQDELIPGKVLDGLKIVAAPGEYEPASFVTQTIVDVSELEVIVSDLRIEGATQSEAVIPAGAVDVRVVKAWFQSGTAKISMEQDRKRRILTPELLLYDDSLVRVDPATQRNFLRVYDADGSAREVPISEVDDPYGASVGASHIPVDVLPVRDADALLPVDIPSGTNKQFWLTVHVPAEAAPGVYAGQVALVGRRAGAREELVRIPIEVHVLPFRLSPPTLVYSIYYRGRLDPTGKGSISSDLKSEQQFRAEAANLVAHGVTRPTLYQPLDDEELLLKALAIWREAGMETDDLYYVELKTGSYTRPEQLAALQDRIRRVIDVARRAGYSEVYAYGLDEARGDKLVSQRPAWQAVHEAGGKVFVAGYEDAFQLVGDLLDILVWNGTLSVEAAAQWHSAGRRIYSYSNPQGGVEDPQVYRRNYGLLLWKAGYDGAMTYAYQSAHGNTWNDFDHDTYRDHNFTYATVDGVIDTIQWEGFREAVDDVRYAATLQRYIEEAQASGDADRAALAREAQAFLDRLDPSQDLDALRGEIIEWILRIMPDV